MDAKQQIKELESLAQLDVDAVGAYTAAINRIEFNDVRMKLNEFCDDHRRHVIELNREIEALGGKPVADRPDAKGLVLRGFTAATSMMGVEASLKAMVSNEKLTNRKYHSAMEMAWADPRISSLIRKNYADEQRHLSWIQECLQTRPWEAHAGIHV